MSSSGKPIVTQLVIDNSGAKMGEAEFAATMDKMKAKYQEGGGAATSFDAAQRKWTQSLAAADPVIRASINMQAALNRQMGIGAEAVKLGITTQLAAEQQLERVRQKYAGYVTSARQAADETNGLRGAVASMASDFTSAMGAVGIAAALGGGAILGFGRKILDEVSSLEDQATQAGVSVAAMQAYRHAIEDSGGSADTANLFISKLSRTLGEAEIGSKQARAEFDALGINWHDLATAANPVEAGAQAVAAAILAIPDPARRAAEEITFFGKSGTQMAAALPLIAQNLDVLMKLYRDRSFNDDDAKKAHDAINKITAAWERLEVQGAPYIISATDRLANLLKYVTSLSAKDWAIDLVFGWRFVAGASSAMDGAPPGGPPDVAPNQPMPHEGVQGAKARVQQMLTGSIEHKGIDDAAKTVERTRKFTGDLRETFAGYLDQLNEAARLDGLSLSTREQQQAVIRAAQIDEKASNAIAGAHHQAGMALSQDYASAAAHLGHMRTAEIEAAAAAAPLAKFHENITNQIMLANVALAASADYRKVAVAIAQAELDTGTKLSAEDKARIANLQHINDLLAAQERAEQLLDPYKDDRDTIAALRAKQQSGAISGAQANYAIGRTGLGGDFTSMRNDLAAANPFSRLGAAAQQGAQDDINGSASHMRDVAKGAFDVGIIDAKQYSNALGAIEADRYAKSLASTASYEDAKLALGQNTFDALATGIGDLFGKQSTAYKVAFGIEKAFQIARIALAAEVAFAQALAAPWPESLFYYAQVVTDIGQIMSAIGSVSASGFANGVVGVQRQGGSSSDIIPTLLTPGESVVNVVGTARNRNSLAAMNAGASLDSQRNWAPAPANSNARPVNVVVNAPPGMRVSKQETADGDVLINIIDDRVKDGIGRHLDRGLEDLASKGSRGVRAIANHRLR